jgi:hypothetical protein
LGVRLPVTHEQHQLIDEPLVEAAVSLLAPLDELAPPAIPPSAEHPARLDPLRGGNRAAIRPLLSGLDHDRPSTEEPDGLGRQRRVDLVPTHLGHDLVPSLGVRRVHRLRSDTHPRRRLDLVPHEGEEGGDQQRGATASVAQQPGGDEVDGALAPTGPLDDEDPLPPSSQCADGFELAGMKRRVRPTRQPSQEL